MAEAQGAELLVPGPQRGGAIEHPHTASFGDIEQMGGIEIGLIHRRILAHPDHLEVLQRQQPDLTQRKPGIGHLPGAGLQRDRTELHRLGQGPGVVAAAAFTGQGRHGREIGGGAHPHRLTSPLHGLHQRHAGILGGIEARDRIDHEQLGSDHRQAAKEWNQEVEPVGAVLAGGLLISRGWIHWCVDSVAEARAGHPLGTR